MDKRIVREITPGVFCFTEPSGERILNFYGIQDDNGWVLVDCGLPGSVEYWVNNGSICGNINRLIITHGDADHFGSGAWLQRNYPDIEIICHENDKDVIENHKLIVEKRYDVARPFFAYGYSQETLDALYGACGKDFKVNRTFKGGENCNIGNKEWNVLHLPGHSPGHIGLLRSEDGVFLFGDAFLADGPPGLDGTPSMPPTHEEMESYLESIAFAEKLSVKLALSGHWLPMDGNSFKQFLAQCKETVFRDIDIIIQFIEKGEKSFAEILGYLNQKVASWECNANDHYIYAVNGYLWYLHKAGKVEFTDENKVILRK